MHAPVLVEVAAGQDQQEPLPDGSGLPALRAVERGGSKGPELLLRLVRRLPRWAPAGRDRREITWLSRAERDHRNEFYTGLHPGDKGPREAGS